MMKKLVAILLLVFLTAASVNAQTRAVSINPSTGQLVKSDSFGNFTNFFLMNIFWLTNALNSAGYTPGGVGGVADGDKGDITVSGSGLNWTVDSGLPATRIADGSISNTEFQYLNGVTSAIQDQLNAKAATNSATLYFPLLSGSFGEGGWVKVRRRVSDGTVTNLLYSHVTNFTAQSGDHITFAGSHQITPITNFSSAAIVWSGLTNVTLEGEGFAELYHPGAGNALYLNGGDNITLKNFRTRSDRTTNAEGVLFASIRVEAGVSNSRFENIGLIDHGDHGIIQLGLPKLGTNNVAIGNWGTRIGWTNHPTLTVDGAMLGGLGAGARYERNFGVNILRGIEQEGNTGFSGEVNILNNVFLDLWDKGVMVFATSNSQTNFARINIQGNNIRGLLTPLAGLPGAAGIWITGGRGVNVSGNNIEEVKWGIGLVGDHAAITDSSVIGNTIYRAENYGVGLVQSVSGREVARNLIANNHVFRSTAFANYFVSGSNNHLSGNTSYGAYFGADAVSVSVVQGATADNRIENHIIIDAQDDGFVVGAGVTGTEILWPKPISVSDQLLVDGGTGTRLVQVPTVSGVLLTTTGDGSGLTALNASQLTSGTIPEARFGPWLADRNGGGFSLTNVNTISATTLNTPTLNVGTLNLTNALGAASGGTGDDTSAVTGVPRITAGNWTYDTGVSHLAASDSAALRGVLTDESGTGAALFANGDIGAATATTPSGGDNDTSVSTTAFVQSTARGSRTGDHATPSTTNPLSPTWDSIMHVVYYNAAGTINLPAAASYDGRSILIYNTAASLITIDPNASEVVVRDGTVQTGGVSFTLSAGAGNYVALISDGARWITLGFKGTLSVGS